MKRFLPVALLFLSMPAMAAEVRLHMTRPATVDLDAWHVRTGVPFARGELTDKDAVQLFRGQTALPVQTEVLATWGPPNSPDGKSIKWLGLDFVQRDLKAGATEEYRLITGERSRTPATFDPVRVEETPEAIRIHNGRLDLVINRKRFNLLESVRADGQAILPRPAPGAYIRDEQGRTYWASMDPNPTVVVEMQGPLAVVVRAEGWFVNPEARDRVPVAGEPHVRPVGGFCRFITRIYVAHGQPAVRVQHTFILTEDSRKTRYGDIGLILSTARDATVQFGGVGEPAAGAARLLQASADQFDLIRGGQSTRGERAEGWVRAGPLAVAVKDFWQNYPKEIEFDPDASTLAVYFWPRHGIARAEGAPGVTAGNGWRLPFVHTGEHLDFSIPEYFLSKEVFGKEASYLGSGQSVEEGMKANALGISRTHDLLIGFGDDAFEARQALFQSAPHVLADPQHIAATCVLGQVAAADPREFPELEARLNRGLLFYLRMLDRARSYGMWNYGDVHHKWVTRGAEWGPSYYRLWGGFHHGKPRLFWWAYMRNGDPALLDFGRAQLSHLADIDLCHWSNAEFASGAPNSNRKMVGGMCDYKGFVHWNAGDRNAYNSMIDIFLYDFYLTGNRRSRDAALAHGYYTCQTGNADQGRAAAGQVDTLVNLYEATWDPKVGERMKARAHAVMRLPPYAQHALFWTPWLWRYWEVTKDPAARAYLLHWADAVFLEKDGAPSLTAIRNDMAAKNEKWWGVAPEDALDIVAYAWYITGRQKYADYCRERLCYRSSFTYLKEGDFFDGWNGQDWYEWSFSIRDSMIALKAAQNGKVTLAGLSAYDSINLVTPRMDNAAGQRAFGTDYPMPATAADQRLVTILYHDGTPCKVPVGSRSQYRTTVARLTDPHGAVVKEYTAKDRTTGFEEVALGPNQPKGYYVLTHESPFSFSPAIPDMERMWFRVGKGVTWCMRRGRAFFYVPPDSEQIELTFAPGYPVGANQYRFMGAGTLYDPDLRLVAPIAIGNEKKQVLSVNVPPGQRGKVWCFVANDLVMLIDVKGIAPWMAASPAAFAEPNRAPPETVRLAQ